MAAEVTPKNKTEGKGRLKAIYHPVFLSVKKRARGTVAGMRIL